MSNQYETVTTIELYEGTVFKTEPVISEYDWNDGFSFNSEQIVLDSFVEIKMGHNDKLNVRPSDVLLIRNKTTKVEKVTETD